MKMEMRNISTYHVGTKISKASDWKLYHDSTTLGQGTETCCHHIASQIVIKGEKEGDTPQKFTLGSLPSASGASEDNV
eukprot:519835-Rhodomonas_salina.1